MGRRDRRLVEREPRRRLVEDVQEEKFLLALLVDAIHRKGWRAEARSTAAGGRRRRRASAPSEPSAGAAGSGGLPPTRKPARTREASRPTENERRCGAVAVAVAVWNLLYAKSTVQTPASGRVRASTSIRGVVA